jgi:hypothetical protein
MEFTRNYDAKYAGRRGRPGERRPIGVQMMPRPNIGRTHPTGMAGPAVEAEAYRRPEGLPLRSFTEETYYVSDD